MKDPSLGIGKSGNGFTIPMNYLTRHGLIAGSTGTGKSRAMQVLAEQISEQDVSVFVSDVKGDASGFCAAGKQYERNAKAEYAPHPIPSNYWSAGDRFIPLRFSVKEAGPVLLSKLLSLNSTQESHLTLAFAYARKNKDPLDDLDQLFRYFIVL